MFRNYDLTPQSYIPHNSCPSKIGCEKPIKPFVSYNAKGEAVGFEWNYGDSILLEFCTSGNVWYEPPQDFTEDAETYLKGKKFLLELYDFRYEIAYSCEVEAATNVKILIDSKSSERLFKGVYHCNFILIDEEEGIKATLVDGEDCLFFIK